uniref:Uncharacterized protein n=1 Tax=Aegilops tauschii TaxID=37682 RepID=M8B6B1_AEGTA
MEVVNPIREGELDLDEESSGVGAAAKVGVGRGGRLAGRSSKSKKVEVVQKLNAYKNRGPSQWLHDDDHLPRHQDEHIHHLGQADVNFFSHPEYICEAMGVLFHVMMGGTNCTMNKLVNAGNSERKRLKSTFEVHRKMKRIMPFCWNCFSGLSNHSDQQAIVNERFDLQWSSHGPVIEILVKNLSLQFSQMGVEIEVSAFVDFLINYKNIDKESGQWSADRM